MIDWRCTFLVVTSGKPRAGRSASGSRTRSSCRCRCGRPWARRGVDVAHEVLVLGANDACWSASVTVSPTIARGPEAGLGLPQIVVLPSEGRRRAGAHDDPVVELLQRYGALSGTFVVPAATMNAPHDSASLPSFVSQSVYVLPSGSAGSPETSRRIGQLPASSAREQGDRCRRSARARSSRSSAPACPGCLGFRSRSRRRTAPWRRPRRRRSRCSAAAETRSRSPLGSGGACSSDGGSSGGGPAATRSSWACCRRARSGSSASTISSNGGGRVAHSSPSSASARRARPLRVRVLTVPSGMLQEVGDLALGEAGEVGEVDHGPLVLGQRLERAVDAPGVPRRLGLFVGGRARRHELRRIGNGWRRAAGAERRRSRSGRSCRARLRRGRGCGRSSPPTARRPRTRPVPSPRRGRDRRAGAGQARAPTARSARRAPRTQRARASATRSISARRWCRACSRGRSSRFECPWASAEGRTASTSMTYAAGRGADWSRSPSSAGGVMAGTVARLPEEARSLPREPSIGC